MILLKEWIEVIENNREVIEDKIIEAYKDSLVNSHLDFMVCIDDYGQPYIHEDTNGSSSVPMKVWEGRHLGIKTFKGQPECDLLDMYCDNGFVFERAMSDFMEVEEVETLLKKFKDNECDDNYEREEYFKDNYKELIAAIESGAVNYFVEEFKREVLLYMLDDFIKEITKGFQY